MNNIQFVFSEEGDWVIVYKNGNFIYEGHNIDARKLLHLLDIPYQEKWVNGEHPIFHLKLMAITEAEFNNLDHPRNQE